MTLTHHAPLTAMALENGQRKGSEVIRIQRGNQGVSPRRAGQESSPLKGQTRTDLVHSVFAQPEWYLARGFNTRIRSEVVEGFVGRCDFQSILDIGCGDDTISLPLLRPASQLTLLDISESMLEIARSHIPPTYTERVRLIQGDFMATSLDPEGFDLILCLGVLAHADSPIRTMEKMVGLLKPGGSLIIQNSDAHHLIGWLFHQYWLLRNRIRHVPYTLNQLGHQELTSVLESRATEFSASYRYNLPIPGITRLFTDSALSRLTRLVYGTPPHNRLAWLGSERIYHFTKVTAA
jgi:ubiquinone/menaquinone biosynthesis C-methylase UbiE